MRSFEKYDETRKCFAEGKQKDDNANEVQKQLQLHDLGVVEYLTDKHALWLNFRMIDENSLHRMGRRIENASEGITLQIEKKRRSSQKSKCSHLPHGFLVEHQRCCVILHCIR